jgi:hypothetical protein
VTSTYSFLQPGSWQEGHPLHWGCAWHLWLHLRRRCQQVCIGGQGGRCQPSVSRAHFTNTSLKPVGCTSFYWACKIGHVVPVLQPYTGSLFTNDIDNPNHSTSQQYAVCQLSDTMCQFFISLQHRGCSVERLPWRQCLQPALWKCSAGWHRP